MTTETERNEQRRAKALDIMKTTEIGDYDSVLSAIRIALLAGQVMECDYLLEDSDAA